MNAREFKKCRHSLRWPDDIPSECSHCGFKFDIRSNLEIGPGAIGRMMRKHSYWLCLVIILIMAVTKLEFLNLGGNGGAMALAIAIILPSIIVHIIAGILPSRARTYCPSCNNIEYHPLPSHLDNRIPNVSE